MTSVPVAVPHRSRLGPRPVSTGWRSVVDRFDQVVAAHPDRPALVGDGVRLTFGELACRSAQLADRLQARGVGPETVVGLMLPRGVDLVVALLATLRAGGAYLPLDPGLPAGRLHDMCDQADALLVLAGATHRRAAPVMGRRVVTVDGPAVPRPSTSRPAAVRPSQRAYVIYTSGSTGRPKGVEVTHGSLAGLLDGLESTVVPGPPPVRVGWNASPSFDASVQQWLRLCRGDTVVLVPDEIRGDPQALMALVLDERLDELDITPSHLLPLLDHVPATGSGAPLRLLVGGEAIGPALWRRLCELRAWGALAAVNMYGPTECTVDSTFTPVAHPGGPHLGVPLPGVRVHLLDDALVPVPSGGEGELYVAGGGVSRGYIGQAALTAQRFVADVVAADGSRMYRTGDRARITEEGRLEFLGRVDDQVKLRGYRIELGEVESVLAECPGVLQAVVVLREDLPGGAGLVGYCRTDAATDLDAVRHAAAARLPEYMIPGALVPMTGFPLTTSGKVDRAALPAPVRPGGDDRAGSAPRTPTEELIAAAWREVLDVDHVGVDDDFFDLGGQSLLAIRMVAHLRRHHGHRLPLVAVFKHPVLAQLARYLDTVVPAPR